MAPLKIRYYNVTALEQPTIAAVVSSDPRDFELLDDSTEVRVRDLPLDFAYWNLISACSPGNATIALYSRKQGML